MFNNRLRVLIAALVCSTLSCAYILGDQNVPPTDDPAAPQVPPTQAPVTEPPTEASTEIPAATVICTDITDQIMEIATSYADTGEQLDFGPRDGDEGTYLVTYLVEGDDIFDPYYEDVPSDLKDEQNDEETQQQIWDYFAALIPADQRELIAEYSVMTDGQDNVLAAVAQTYDDPALWALEVDILDSGDAYNLTYTLVHEFGHLLTLHPDQVPPSEAIFNNPDDNDIYLQEVSACPQFFPGEGCAEPDAYINAFYDQFWADIYDEWNNINLEEDDDVYYDRLDAFYNKYEDQFVNDYAVTDPVEDIAESWSFFVLGPKPAGDTIAEEKILFFHDYPELVALRGQILNSLCESFPQ